MGKKVSKLDIVQATALVKLAEKRVDELKKAGEQIKPGTYSFEFSVNGDGSLSRGDDTEATPPFRMESLYKALLIRYATEMKDPSEWLKSLLAIDGALGAVVQLGSDAVLKNVDAELVAIHDAAVEAAKKKFQAIAKKQPRSGLTTVVGELEVRPVVSAK